MKKSIYLFLLFLMTVQVNAQEHYQVEFAPVSPPIEEIIKSYKGYPAIPVMANDLNGTTHNLMDLKGKNVFLYFWNKDCIKCFDHLAIMHELQDKYATSLQIISFSDEDKETNRELVDEWQIKFPVIPNSRTLADGPYGGDLGYPRLFAIDDFGIIRTVLSKENFDAEGDLFQKVEKTMLSK